MSDIGALVERLIEHGLSIGEASSIIAEAVAAGAASAAYRRSPGAVRQERYRERHKASQSDAPVTPEISEEDRHKASQSVTSNAALSIVNNKKEKRERRATQLPDGWRPGEEQWAFACKALGDEKAQRELRKFSNHAAQNGRTVKNWNAAWNNWIERAVEWAPPPPAASNIAPFERDWEGACKLWKSVGKWTRGHGPDPDSPACQCPREILEKHGIRHEHRTTPTQETTVQSRT